MTMYLRGSEVSPPGSVCSAGQSYVEDMGEVLFLLCGVNTDSEGLAVGIQVVSPGLLSRERQDMLAFRSSSPSLEQLSLDALDFGFSLNVGTVRVSSTYEDALKEARQRIDELISPAIDMLLSGEVNAAGTTGWEILSGCV